MLTNREKAIKFVGHFLTWYQNSFSLPDVVNNIKLEELVKEAEEIHTERVKQLYRELDERYHKEVILNLNEGLVKKPTRKSKRP